MNYTNVWKGIKESTAKLEGMARDVDAAGREIVVKGAALVITYAQQNFAGAHAKGQPHIETSNGGPNIVTGDLRRSIIMDPIVRLGFSEYMTQIGPTMVYGRAVELGLKNGANYPYFGPAVEKAMPEIDAISAETWARLV